VRRLGSDARAFVEARLSGADPIKKSKPPRRFRRGWTLRIEHQLRRRGGSYGADTPVKSAICPARALAYSPFGSRRSHTSTPALRYTSMNLA